ncbi:MAG: hypothetical protein HDR06_17105 [Lachnospiraceae bacterium]|nr:hypothetical protein [Lachnospiraceae bacterium]
MFFSLYDLYQDIINYDRIYIYGMGMYSEMIVPKLCDLGLKEKIAGYVLSQNFIKEKFKEDIPIYTIDNLYVDCTNSIFLIAVSSKYECEIEEILQRYQYSGFLSLSHYERNNDVHVFTQYKNADYNKHCKLIAEWYEYKYSEEIGGRLLERHEIIVDKIKEKYKNREQQINNCNKRQIVFIVAVMIPRVNKIVGALKEKGYEIIILDMCNSDHPYAQYIEGIKVVYCVGMEEVLLEALNYAPFLYYFFIMGNDSLVANIMLMNKVYYGRVVVDIYDVLKGSYNVKSENAWRYEAEKEVLEQADGVVWRYDAEVFLQEKYGYRLKNKSIQFWDYCYDDFVSDEPENDGILRLCMIDSSAFCLHVDHYDELDRQGIVRDAEIFDVLNKIGNRPECELYLYISKVSKSDLDTLISLKKEFKNFYFFVGHSPKMIIKSIAKCDYGCCFYCLGRVPSDAECIEKGYYRLAGTYQVSATNRHFDFLNAGIPVLTSYDGKRQMDYLKGYGVLVDMTLDDLDIEYLMENKYIYRKKVKEAAPFLAIGNQIGRLISFFDSL